MKRLLTASVLLALLACAGTKARESVLMPAMAQAWSTVIRPVIETSDAVDGTVLDTVDDALASGDAAVAIGLMRLWTDTLLPAFLDVLDKRVASGEIGTGVALSLIETTRQFELNLMRLVSRPTP